MKLAMAQIQMTDSMESNLEKTLQYCDQAKDSDLLFFPEIQLSPFFPQYEKADATKYCMNIDHEAIKSFKEKQKANINIGLWICYDRHLPESIRTSTLKRCRFDHYSNGKYKDRTYGNV